MRTYFGGEFSEAAIRSNFVLVYELLDEVADHGWPQVREEKSFLFFCSSFFFGSSFLFFFLLRVERPENGEKDFTLFPPFFLFFFLSLLFPLLPTNRSRTPTPSRPSSSKRASSPRPPASSERPRPQQRRCR